MRWWVDIMACHGRGQVYTFPPAFFHWIESQVVMIDDYTYAGTNFRGDPDLVLPCGGWWDIDLGK